MRFVVLASALQGAIEKIARVVDPKELIPILRNVCLRTRSGMLELTGTDLVRTITITIPARTEDTAETTIEAFRLAAFVGGLPGDAEIGATIDDKRAELRCGRRVATLSVLPADSFPPREPVMTDATAIKMIAGVATRLATIVDVAEISERVYLGGIHLYDIDDSLIAEAASGPGCIREITGLQAKIPAERTALLPAETVKLFPLLFEDFDLEISDRKLRASNDTISLTSKLLEGRFPTAGIDNILNPSVERPLSITLDANELISAATRIVKISADERNKRQDVQIVADGDRVNLVAKRNDLSTADAEDSIAAECDIERSGVRSFTINAQFAAKLLKAIGGETVRLSQAGSCDTILVESVANVNIRAAIAPMRGIEIATREEQAAA